MSELASRTLLLNSTYEPLKVIPWQRAVTLLWLGKVEVIRSYERDVRSVTFRVRMPAVVRLLRFVRRKEPQVSFSRRNLFARDASTCQYCRRQLESNELTYDHVVPRAMGGRTEWTNIVTCCVDCNRRKGGRTPEQAGMRLLKPPRRPDRLPTTISFTIGVRTAPEAWRDFLYWNLELDADDPDKDAG
jgi:5-methylcytosine-specific restriction endonuclease McrA